MEVCICGVEVMNCDRYHDISISQSEILGFDVFSVVINSSVETAFTFANNVFGKQNGICFCSIVLQVNCSKILNAQLVMNLVTASYP